METRPQQIDADTLELAFDHALLAGAYICVGPVSEKEDADERVLVAG